ncbi:slit homolog 1 protein-like [Pecten maximus]|uniref:slit homolog 1 protein-like n=1 Tax=Pecten maximus TaxID=6579 RepID=UPI0014585F42|nr:slit homolog 1 protein-like [Pecten maximus]
MSELEPLDVEYTTIRGSSILSGRYDIKSKLEHEAGYLDALPNNICQYQLLVYVDLSGNNIKEIGNISCLTKLDTLDLSENQLSYIYNNTFRGLVSLRKLDLANNKISYIEPYSWSHQTSTILNIQLEGNDLSEVDVTNVIINRPFCNVDYKHNNIENIVNEAGWTLRADDEIVQGGFIDLTENSMSGIIDFLNLGVTDLKVLGKIFSYGIDVHDVPFQCDCRMEPFFQLAESSLQVVWRSYFDMYCFSPEQLRNRSIPELIRSKQYDLFICDIPQTEGCPYNCNCYKQPSRDRVVVNCSGHGLDMMPKHVPRNDLPLEIYLDNNSISSLEWRGYLNQTRKLVLSNNSITTMEGRALNQLQKNATEVDLLGNTGIKDLPEDIRYLKPSIFIFGELTIHCNCSNTWYGEWIKMHENEKGDMNKFWCHTENSIKEAAEVVTEEFLDCSKPSMLPKWITVALAILTSLVLGISLIAKVFKYEIYLLFRTLRNKYKTYPDMYYDVYVSYDETTDEINKWIMNGLLPALEQDGYRVCIPARDFNVGIPYEDEIADFMGRSKFVLMLFSNNEKNVFWDLEWKRAWYLYTRYQIKNIILINFDILDYESVTHPVLRAFVRLGMSLDFANMKQSLPVDIKKKLGCPSRINRRLETEYANCKTRFNRHDMLEKR